MGAKNLNITTLDQTTNVSVVNTWAKHGGIPQESKLLIIGILNTLSLWLKSNIEILNIVILLTYYGLNLTSPAG